MSSLHKSEIAAILSRWLERYSPPLAIKENPRAQQDEADALLAVLLKFAPAPEPGPWVRRALDTIEYRMKTRAWPTKGELAEVCADQRKKDPTETGETFSALTPEQITARRMERGEAVGEGWLYGRMACDLIATGQVSRELMESYRSGAFLARQAAYGRDAAIAWENEAKQRHEDAREIHRQKAHRNTGEAE